MTGRVRTWSIALGLILAAALGYAYWRRAPQGPSYVTAEVTRGPVARAITTTGAVDPVITVEVGAYVSGTIQACYCDYNTQVKAGQLCAKIDPRPYQVVVDQDAANLANAQAQLKKDEASLTYAKISYDRDTGLLGHGIVSRDNVDSDKSTYDQAVAQVKVDESTIQQRQAELHAAQVNLDYTNIISPVDGTVVSRNITIGQTVAASFQTPTLFLIAQDLTKMQVYAKTDESDVGNIRPGKPVTFKVDAFPKDLFRGVVKQVRMNPTMVQSVVTYDTIIEFENPELKLFPGMTGYVTIPVATAEHVVKIPNAALRYKPPLASELVRSLYAKYGIDDGRPGEEAKGPKPPGVRTGGAPGPSRSPRVESAVVWQLSTDGSLQPVKVALGITDHTYTEVTRVLVGTLKLGDEVVTTSVKSNTLPPGAQGISR